MPSRKANAAAARREQKYYPAMMRIAAEMGCDMKPMARDPVKMRGMCPFHAAVTRRTARTLDIDTLALRFTCSYCNASGTPTAFAAMAWNVSARDAKELLDAYGKDVGAQRPSYKRGDDQRYLPNTAVLTRAAEHYRRQLTAGSPLSMPALALAAQLGLDLERAAAAGMGICTGEGLAEYLRETGVSAREIRESSLFLRGDPNREFLAGRVVFADTDYTGATLWLNSLNPRGNGNGMRLGSNRPGTIGLNGPHPYLMGMDRARTESREVILTDDARLHLVVRAEGRASLLWSNRREDESTAGKQEAARRIAERFSRVPARTAVLMMHDSGARSMCAKNITEDGRPRRILSLGKDEILRQLNPLSRDLTEMVSRTESSGDEPGDGRDEPGDGRRRTRRRPGRTRRRRGRGDRHRAGTQPRARA